MPSAAGRIAADVTRRYHQPPFSHAPGETIAIERTL